jgi:dinuclear metal center YbgI/SA1388 family protein
MTFSGAEVLAHLDSYLRVAELPDDERALNGLQVENSGKLTKLIVAVDACQATIEATRSCGGDLLLVHHGLFWGGPLPLTGRHGRRVRTLIEGDIALYSAHLPLDCHPEVGNNAVLARDLGVTDGEWFGEYLGVRIGYAGSLAMNLATLAERITARLGVAPRVLAHGRVDVRRIAVVTGEGSGLMKAALECGVDTFITGEGPHHTFLDAEEWGINVIYAGHYATETVGVQALAKHLESRFGLPWEFVDHPSGL